MLDLEPTSSAAPLHGESNTSAGHALALQLFSVPRTTGIRVQQEIQNASRVSPQDIYGAAKLMVL